MSDVRDPNQDPQQVLDAYRRLPRVLPPAALDAAVLAQARAAVSKPAGPTRRPRWLLPAGIAATAVLVIGVASRLGREQAENAWPARVSVPASETALPSGKATPRVAPAAQEPAAATPRDNEVVDEARKSALPAAPAQPGLARARVPATTPEAGKDASAQTAASEPAEAGRLEAERRFAAPKPDAAAPKEQAALPPASPPMTSPQPFPSRDDRSFDKVVAEPQGIPAKAAPAPARAKQEAALAPVEAAQATGGGNAPAAPATEQKAPAAPTAASRQGTQPAPAPSITGTAKRTELDAAAKAEQGIARPSAIEGAQGFKSGVDPSERARPDTWIAAIRRILAAGDEANARKELAEFRRRHPQAAIPDDLAPLAE